MKRRKLSTARSRTELVSDFKYGAPDNMGMGQISPAPAAALADASSPPAPSEGGAAVDPNAPKECALCEASNDPNAKFCDQCGGKFEEMGEEGEEGEDAMATSVPPTPAAGEPPVTSPQNDGGIDNGVVCANGDCGHLASDHVNGDGGANTGQCSVDGCDCAAMQIDVAPNPDASADGEGVTAAGEIVPQPAADAGVELNKPPEVEGGESMGPAFTIPVAIIEGQPTGDGRQIAPNALTWRVPPIPLMGLATETHDPEGWDLNDPAVICGRIDSFERTPGEGSTQLISAHGFYLPNEDGMYFAELNEAMGRMGVSADVAVQATEITIGDVDADGWPIDMAEVLTEGTIMGLTVCPYPAFEGAYIVLGDGAEAPEAQEIPQTTEEDAPTVPSTPPAAVTAGGQLLHFMSYEECLPCDLGFDVVTASGAGPTRPPKAWFSNPNFTPEDGRLVEILDRRGQRAVGGKYACPLTVEDNGRVYGHIAPWDVCHTGTDNSCILAPHSAVDYAHFKRGQHIITAEGEKIRVGVLTADTGHAPTRGISASAAMAHYDNTALACADVNIGDDEYGIWVAGAIRPDATDEQIRRLTASSISGDWRALGGQLELVAALAVNQPGFPLAVVASGEIESLTAAGTSVMHALKHQNDETVNQGDTVLRAALAPMLRSARDMANERLAALRG